MAKFVKLVQGEWSRHAWLLIAIISAGIIVYVNSLSNQFVWDDEGLIIKNSHVKSFHYTGRIFVTDLFREGEGIGGFYRPIQTISYMIDYAFWKLNPFGYHLTNIFLHILTSISVYSLTFLISSDVRIAALSALFFVIHPVHTEAITYISGRADPLYSFFLLVALLLYAKYKAAMYARRYVFLIGACLAYIMALLSKEFSLVFLLLIILYEYFLPREQRGFRTLQNLTGLLVFFGISCAYAIVRFLILGSSATEGSILQGLRERILTFCTVFPKYIGLLLYPVNLHMERNIPNVQSAIEPAVIFSLIFIFLYILVTLLFHRKWRQVFFGLAWFLVALIPVSGILPQNATMLEHWLYLPSIGFFILLAMLIVKVWDMRLRGQRRFIARGCVSVITVLLLVFHARTTIARNEEWKDPIAFYQITLKSSPNSSRIHYNLGNAYREIGNYDGAIKEYQEAINLYPEYTAAWNNLGLCFFSLGLYQEAMSSYKKALETNPASSEAHCNLGVLYEEKGFIDEAINSYIKALNYNQDLAQAHCNLGGIYHKKKLYDRAMDEYRAAIKSDPYLAQAYYNMGLLNQERGLESEAITAYQMAVRIDKGYINARRNLDALYTSKRLYQIDSK